VNKGTYAAVLFSFIIHGLILALLLLTRSTKQITIQPISKNTAIKSYIYYAPKITKAPLNESEEPTIIKEPVTPKNQQEQQTNNTGVTATENDNPQLDKNGLKTAPREASESYDSSSQDITLPPIDLAVPMPPPTPKPVDRKLDSFTQLQRLRSKLNNNAAINTDNPYQKYQPPSVFNKTVESVPHSIPLKDEEKARENRTKNMAAGIAITKGEDGRCSITQDLSVYGLSEGSSTQFFACGESKFDKNFREHMKKVNTKMGKK
tara:strand:+ start:62453 stop:63241 length:789 start_codon:yes stop_codon:yes gene_type:complete